MTSYLEEYERNSWGFGKLAKAVGATLLAGIVGYCVLLRLSSATGARNPGSRSFLALARKRSSTSRPTKTWGCTVAEPCQVLLLRGVPGRLGARRARWARSRSYQLGRSYTQEGGVILEVHINGEKQPNLWVESGTRIISFFPY